MSEGDAKLKVEALAEAFAEAKSASVGVEAAKDSSKLVELASQAPRQERPQDAGAIVRRQPLEPGPGPDPSGLAVRP